MDPAKVFLNVGQKIDVEVPDEFSEDSSKTLRSQVLDIIDDDTFMVAAPFYKGNYHNLHKNAVYKFLFGYEDKGLYYFSGVITDSGKNNQALYFIVKKITPFEKYQRRYFYRLRHIIEVKYRKISKSLKDFEMASKFNKGLTKDISGSGLCIVTDENFSVSDMLEVILPIDGEELVLECRVIRSAVKNYGSVKKHEIGLAYENISEKDRYKIVKYIFTQQRLMIQEQKKKLEKSNISDACQP